MDPVVEDITQPILQEELKAKKSGLAPYFRIWRYGTPVDHLIRVCGIISAFANGAALPLMTLFFGDMVDKFDAWGNGTITLRDFMHAVSRNALWFTYLFIGIFVLSFTMNTCFKITATRTIKTMRREFVRSLVRQEITYFDSCLPGSVATLISNNANLIENGLGERLALAFEGLGQLIVAFIVAFSRVWRLTLVVATLLPLTIITITAAVIVMTKIDVKILKIYGQAGGLAEEALSTMPIITAFGATKQFHERYNSYLERAKQLGVKKGPIMGLQMSVQWAITFCAYALAWFYGAQLVANQEAESGGKVLTVLTAILIGIISMTLIVPAVGEIAKASAAAEGLFEIIDRKSRIDPLSSDGKQPSSVIGHLRLENVSFAYPSRPAVNVLHGLTLDFEAGKTTAIVGASGSGKSTVLALLTRWFDADAGSVLFDGEEVKGLNIHWLRRQMGYVQQEPVLLNDTIFNNVCHGLFCTPNDQETADEKFSLVKGACKQAFADEFIEQLPDKYNTHVGDRGGLLSGGQKQRIAIARSAIRDPPILLLDEATSALDPAAEAIVQKALDNVSKSRTTIVIAHKLSTVQKADKIIVLSRGRLMEQGNHQELLAKRGLYFALVSREGLEEQQELVGDVHFDDTIKESTNDDIENDIATRTSSPHDSRKPTSDLNSKQLTLFQSLAKIMKQQRHLWLFFTGGVIGAIGSGSVFPVQAVIFSKAVLIFQLPIPEKAHEMKSQGNFWGEVYLALALGVLIFYAGLGFCFTATAFHVSTFYRSRYFAALLGQDIGYFNREGHSASAATSRLSTDPQLLQDLIATNLGFILLSIVNVLASCTLALAVGWKIAIVAIFGCLPAIFFAGFVRMRIEMTSQSRMSKIYLESTRLATEAVSVIRTVSSLTMEEKIMRMYDDRLNAASTTSLVQAIVSNTLFALTESLYLATLALVFWWGASLVSRYEYSLRDFYLVFIAVIFGGQAAGFMFGMSLQTTKALNAIKDIMNLLASRPAINTSTGKKDLIEKQPEVAVEFRGVCFNYPNRPTVSVIQNLSFSINRGESIGIVGASGSGKSTIIALMERFYDAASGIILFNGIPVLELDVHAHRSRIGLVSQDTMMYQGSIFENVAFGIPEGIEVCEEQIVQACKEASIHDFIQSLPDGYGTDVGIRGISLSGGQRQRIAIARALVRDPQILLLDEATSALDSENERLVQQAIERAAKLNPHRTAIAVAHRLTTIQRCDRIFVLHAGGVVEEGTHAELLAQRGRYFQMALAQKLDQEIA